MTPKQMLKWTLVFIIGEGVPLLLFCTCVGLLFMAFNHAAQTSPNAFVLGFRLAGGLIALIAAIFCLLFAGWFVFEGLGGMVEEEKNRLEEVKARFRGAGGKL